IDTMASVGVRNGEMQRIAGAQTGGRTAEIVLGQIEVVSGRQKHDEGLPDDTLEFRIGLARGSSLQPAHADLACQQRREFDAGPVADRELLAGETDQQALHSRAGRFLRKQRDQKARVEVQLYRLSSM